MDGHSQAKNEKTLTEYIWDGLATDHNFSLVKTTTRFLVITMPGSYWFNIAKILEQTFYSSYIPIGKIRPIYRHELE